MSGKRKSVAIENETSTIEAAAVPDIDSVGMVFEKNMKFAIEVERVCRAFVIADKESEARRGVSDSTDKACVKEHTAPG